MSSPEEVLPGLLRLSLDPFDIVNVYLLGDVLVDSGPSFTTKRLLKALEGLEIAGHALTHVHFDHRGASRTVCERLGVPLWCGKGDRTALESGDFTLIMPNPRSWFARLAQRIGGPPQPVSRTLREGDEVGGFTVIETPGHTPGHLSFWRERDRALVLGDVLFHRNPMTLRRALQEPFNQATYNPSQNRESARKVATLHPAVICFGHGRPLLGSEAFSRYVAGLRSD